MMGELAEEWEKNITVIPIHTKGGKQKVEFIVDLMCFIKYSAVVNEKFKAQSKQFLCFARMVSEKADIVLVHSLQ